VTAVPDELQDIGASAGVEDVVAEDVLLTAAPARPISAQLPMAWVANERARSSAPTGSDHDREAPQQLDQLAEAAIAAHMLSSLSDESATSHSISSSRQSA
jgi:hypothetical protein